MKTLLIRGDTDPPSELRDIVRAGSTAVDEVSTTELSTFVSRQGFGVDRIVVWAAPDDDQVRTLASTYAANESSADPGRLVYVTPGDCRGAPSGVGRDVCLSWPEDKDKVRMFFMTGG
jgi:hypothetical protein